jgi:hypothetical protein
VTLNKTWDESGTNMSINYYRNQNLTTNNIDEYLPNINFSKAIAYPFKGDNSDTETRQKWYEMIGYNYSGQFQNQRLTSDGNLTIHGGILHNISISASPKVGYFTIAPSFNYTEKWYNKRSKQDYENVPVNDPITGQFSHDSLEFVSKDINQLNFVRSFNMNVSAKTKIYGIFNPNLLGVQSIRHTLLPSVSYNYTPDFSKAGWGYYDSYTKPTGEVVRYDKFGDQIFGGAGSGETQSLNFALSNIYEMKMIKSPTDTTKEQKKFQLLNLGASVNYNFSADSMKLSSLNLDYRTQVGDFLNLQGSSSYTFYDQVRKVDNVGTVSYSDVNQFLSSHGKGLFRLTSLYFAISTTLSGDKLKGNEAKTTQNEKTDEGMQIAPKKTTTSIYDENTYPDLTIPWSLSLGYSYNLSKSDPVNSTSYSSLNASLNFSITKYWKFIIQGSYDFDKKEISAPEITIYRDLHEWEMNFTWRPTGLYSGFHFEIRLKAPELQDVKVTKSGGILSGRE